MIAIIISRSFLYIQIEGGYFFDYIRDDFTFLAHLFYKNRYCLHLLAAVGVVVVCVRLSFGEKC